MFTVEEFKKVVDNEVLAIMRRYQDGTETKEKTIAALSTISTIILGLAESAEDSSAAEDLWLVKEEVDDFLEELLI